MRRSVGAVALACVASAAALAACGRAPSLPPPEAPPERTLAETVALVGPEARVRLAPRLAYAALGYPPREIALLAFKQERRLELWARADGESKQIATYPIVGASGHLGPKLREGDRQVPEGLYRIVGLDPNSRYHLSMQLDYPNDYDRAEAEKAGRQDLGGDVFIHGTAASAGCLAVGDLAIEELFVLVADVGMEHVAVIVSPRR